MTTNCSKCDCAKAQCGCDDRGLTTNPPCATGTPACPNPEPCAETWSDCCVIHNGDSFTYLFPPAPNVAEAAGGAIDLGLGPIVEKTGFTILQGERMCDTWQRFIAYYECGTGAPYGLKSKVITSTTINVAWTPLDGVDSYEVFYSLVSPISWTSAGIVMQNTTPNLTITGLTPNTTYYVNVIATTANVAGCASVSLILTTKLV